MKIILIICVFIILFSCEEANISNEQFKATFTFKKQRDVIKNKLLQVKLNRIIFIEDSLNKKHEKIFYIFFYKFNKKKYIDISNFWEIDTNYIETVGKSNVEEKQYSYIGSTIINKHLILFFNQGESDIEKFINIDLLKYNISKKYVWYNDSNKIMYDGNAICYQIVKNDSLIMAYEEGYCNYLP